MCLDQTLRLRRCGAVVSVPPLLTEVATLLGMTDSDDVSISHGLIVGVPIVVVVVLGV